MEVTSSQFLALGVDHFVAFVWPPMKNDVLEPIPVSVDQRKHSPSFCVMPYTFDSNPMSWTDLYEHLSKVQISSFLDLQDLLLFIKKGPNNCLEILYNAVVDLLPEDRESFFSRTVPFMLAKACEIVRLLPQPLPLLTCNSQVSSISLSYEQCFCLLACSFLGLFPLDRLKFPSFDITKMFSGKGLGASQKYVRIEKLKCLLLYFNVISREGFVPGILTYKRNKTSVTAVPDWKNSKSRLKKVEVINTKLEDSHTTMCIMNFCNRRFGGGVLGSGAVQEELLLVQFPEALLGLLLFEDLCDNEAVLVSGARRFSLLAGYGANIKYVGPISPQQPAGPSCIVCIDAIPFTCVNRVNQLETKNLNRELLKAFTGFTEPDVYPPRIIGSGKWGCGIFNGDVQVKSIVQLLAASVCGRPLVMHIIDDDDISDSMKAFFDTLWTKNLTVGRLYRGISKYKFDALGHKDLFSYVLSELF